MPLRSFHSLFFNLRWADSDAESTRILHTQKARPTDISTLVNQHDTTLIHSSAWRSLNLWLRPLQGRS
ncbi:hypothetical protein U2A4042520014 [Corynebacterium striatum]|nr:hypothetical protein U2A4042520014 [Corynebacterium striatum]